MTSQKPDLLGTKSDHVTSQIAALGFNDLFQHKCIVGCRGVAQLGGLVPVLCQ